MSSVLICSNPAVGHIGPVLGVARALLAQGDRVRILTGSAFRDRIEAAGAEFLPLPAAVDWDHPDYVPPASPGKLEGVAAARFDIVNLFARAMGPQWAALRAALEAEQTDAVLAESLFTGVVPLLDTPRAERPLVVNLTIFPLAVAGKGVPPYGLGLHPMSGPLGALRDAIMRRVSNRLLFDHVDRAMNEELGAVLGRETAEHFQSWPERCDLLVSFTVPSFEYPHIDLPENVRFVGPILGSAAGAASKPHWWGDLDGHRPIVHVTQGTVANQHFDDLVLPAIEGLAGEDVLVVVTTGGRPRDSLPAELPANVRVGEFLPYDELFPRLDVVVTNGGYGGVHVALAHGVPLVVAGTTEDKTEVTARVAWSGAGINLKTNTATPDAVRKAVRAVLADGRYRANSRRIGEDIAAAPGAAALSALIAERVTA